MSEIKLTDMTIRERMYILHHIMTDVLTLLWKPFAVLTAGIFLQATGGPILSFITPNEAKDWFLLVSAVLTFFGSGGLTVYKIVIERRKMQREIMKEEKMALIGEREALERLKIQSEKHIIEQVKELVALGMTHEQAFEKVEKSKLI